MELEHSFTVPVPEQRAWEVLLDVEKVAPCMPGATLDSVDGDDITGRIKVKVGPIAMTYSGQAHFTDRDPAAHVVTLEAAGKETRGAGTASATVRSVLEGQGDQTKVTVHTTLNVTGRPAQFGRGVMAEVGGKLIGIFASNLADMLAADTNGSASSPGANGNASPTEGSPTEASPTEASTAEASPTTASADNGSPPKGRPAADDDAAASAGATSAADQLALPIEELGLPIRPYNGLRRDGIHTLRDLVSLTSEQLLAIGNIGPASVTEIRQKLADRGLALSGELAASPEPSEPGPATSTGTTAGPAGSEPAPAAASTPAASTPPPASSSPAWDPGATDDDAIDLLSVAGMPLLKRAVPAAAAALVLALLVALGLRRRKRTR
jgi:carbon monoxide dehydrogenase subunit G